MKRIEDVLKAASDMELWKVLADVVDAIDINQDMTPGAYTEFWRAVFRVVVTEIDNRLGKEYET